MEEQSSPLEVYATGKVTVVGFGGNDVPLDFNFAWYREYFQALISEQQCKVFAIDLEGVTQVPSGFLGVVTSLRDLGVDIELYNVEADIRDVLELTRLDQFLSIRDVDVPRDSRESALDTT